MSSSTCFIDRVKSQLLIPEQPWGFCPGTLTSTAVARKLLGTLPGMDLYAVGHRNADGTVTAQLTMERPGHRYVASVTAAADADVPSPLVFMHYALEGDRCKNGHLSGPENIFVRSSGVTVCRECEMSWRVQLNERRLAERAERRAEVKALDCPSCGGELALMINGAMYCRRCWGACRKPKRSRPVPTVHGQLSDA
jgi:hypothetical protein